MEEEEGGGIRLSKRFSDKGGEVDYKTKAGTAWSHSYLNQKPWHPLSYPNQRRKWIAEQIHSQRERRAEEVAREYAQEQEFFRQTALVSKKEKEKMEMMKAVSFMYVRPPGYNAESAKAADMADERKKQEQESTSHVPSENGASMLKKFEAMPSAEERKKPKPKDVFGRVVPTEEQFEVLKNAPRLETGVAARSKPFGVEIRNVKCLRCGNFGHQSGDRECPLKDVIMPSEESRLKRDDPLTAILAQTDISEPLKWELKQKPGLSPPRGGFKADDPNQQIVAEDIFDEYGGFLGGDDIPELLTNFYSSNPKRKSSRKGKHKRKLSPSSTEVHDQEKGSTSSDDGGRRLRKKREKKLGRKHLHSSLPENSDFNMQYDAKDNNRSSAGGDRGSRSKNKRHDKKSRRLSESNSQDSDLQFDPEDKRSLSGEDRERRSSNKERHKRKSRQQAYSRESDYDYNKYHKRLSDDERERRAPNKESHRRKLRKHSCSSESDYSDYHRARHSKRSIRYKHSHQTTSENSDLERHYGKKNGHRHRHRHHH